MNPSDRLFNTLFLAVLICTVLFLGSTAWVATRAISWARDLPNRINIEFDADSLGDVVTESMRLGLQAEDEKVQLEMIHSLAQMADQNPNGVAWINMEFMAELEAAAQSPKTEIAAAASELLERIDPGTPDR